MLLEVDGLVAQTQAIAETPADTKGPTEAHDAGTAFRPSHAPLVVGAWLIGVLVMLGRTASAIIRPRHWLAGGEAIDSNDFGRLEALIAELSGRMRLRQTVRLVVCAEVNVPAVLGTIWPAILIPPAMVTGVPVEQWRIILAHELAHVRRYDNLVNLAQMLVESLFFFNPAVWWISRQVRAEREGACDALAAEVTGQPASVARTLVNVAQLLQDRGTPIAASLTALAAPGDSGSLTDRVRRLLQPGSASRPRLTRTSLLLAIVMAAATVTVLQQGTALAVRAAAEWMTPKERVETLARLQAEQANLPPVSASAPGGNEPWTDTSTESEADINVTIHVRTEDGTRVPSDLNVCANHRSRNSTGYFGLGDPGREIPEFTVSRAFPPGEVVAAAVAPGFAPAISRPCLLSPGDREREIELVLTRGFSAKLRMVRDDGNAVPGVHVRVNLLIGPDRWMGLGQQDVVSDENGMIVIKRAGNNDYQLRMRQHGYQRESQRCTFSPGKTVEWKITRAIPTAVRVLDPSGKPVSGAELVLTRCRSGHVDSGYGDPRRHRDEWSCYSISDQDGRAVLDELLPGCTYGFTVLAPGYRPALVTDITAGRDERSIRLGPALHVSGRLTGALDRLQRNKREGKTTRKFTYRNDLRIGDTSMSDMFYAEVDEDGRFELSDLVPGTVQLELPGGVKKLDVQASMTGLAFRIPETDQPEPEVAMREVVLRLTGTSPDAPARGHMFVSGSGLGRFRSGEYAIVDNEVRVRVPVSASLWITPRDVVGYMFEAKHGVEILAGEEPQVIELPTRPAGAVLGRVLRADGSEADDVSVHVFALKLPEGMQGNVNFHESSSTSSAAFFQSLPLGGRYQLVAREFTSSTARWVASDEFDLDASHPIEKLELRLPEGRSMTVRVVDGKGRAVSGVPVELECSFSANHSSQSQRVTRTTAPDGVARFENTVLDGDTGSLRRSFYLVVASFSGHVGWQGKLTEAPARGGADHEIRLKPAVSASGVLLDVDTGRPIPGANIRLTPVSAREASFLGMIETTTDDRGEFRFDNLEPIHYEGHIDGTAYGYPADTTIRGGSPTPVRWRVKLREGSRLKAMSASAGE